MQRAAPTREVVERCLAAFAARCKGNDKEEDKCLMPWPHHSFTLRCLLWRQLKIFLRDVLPIHTRPAPQGG